MVSNISRTSWWGWGWMWTANEVKQNTSLYLYKYYICEHYPIYNFVKLITFGDLKCNIFYVSIKVSGTKIIHIPLKECFTNTKQTVWK